MTVRNLAASVGSLVQQMPGSAQRLDSVNTTHVTQDAIRKEAIEVHEREKCKRSIILKYLTANTCEEASNEARTICSIAGFGDCLH